MKKQSILLSLLLVNIFLLAACTKNMEERHTIPQDKSVLEDRVITIQDKTFTKDDLEFYTLMKKIQIEMNRHYHVNDREDELQDVNDYWDEQLAYYDNINVQLQNLVELYAISLLAEEKHYDVPSEKLEQAVKTFRDDVKDIKKANEYIEHYGEARFNQNIYDYTRQSMLRDRVVADLEKQIKEEQPFIRKEELNYFLSKQFEELSIGQMNDLVIEVHVK